jgi:hypothetical protein
MGSYLAYVQLGGLQNCVIENLYTFAMSEFLFFRFLVLLNPGAVAFEHMLIREVSQLLYLAYVQLGGLQNCVIENLYTANSPKMGPMTRCKNFVFWSFSTLVPWPLSIC